MTPEQAKEKFEPTISVLMEQIEAEVMLDCSGVSLKHSSIQVDEGMSYSVFFGLSGTLDWDAEVEFEIDIADAWDGGGKTIRFRCFVFLDSKEVSYVRPAGLKPPPSLSDDKLVESQFDLFESMVDVPKIARLIVAHLNEAKQAGK